MLAGNGAYAACPQVETANTLLSASAKQTEQPGVRNMSSWGRMRGGSFQQLSRFEREAAEIRACSPANLSIFQELECF